MLDVERQKKKALLNLYSLAKDYFSSVSSEDTVLFLSFTMWWYHVCHDYFSLASRKSSSEHLAHLPFSFPNHLSWKIIDGIFKSATKFRHIFSGEQTKRIDGRFALMADGEVDYLIEMEEIPTQGERHCMT